MAYKINWKIISQRFKPKVAKQIQDKEVWKAIFYIEPKTFYLWDWKIIDKKWGIYICNMICKNINKQWEQKIMNFKRNDFSFIKRK